MTRNGGKRPRPSVSKPAPSYHGGSNRDARGRFIKGNQGGPGNPFARQVAALRSALVRAVTEQDIDDIAMALMLQAKAGDVASAKLLLAYVIGKPAETVEPDRVDIDEWEVVQQSAAQAGEVVEALQGLHAPTASKIVSLALPAMGDEFAAKLREDLIAMNAEPGADRAGGRNGAGGHRSAPSTNRGNGGAAQVKKRGHHQGGDGHPTPRQREVRE